ncbi:hypothetical protein RIF29_25500 [Crotalaria pallida]|uniref:Uncharacterized protein n=1 Tax=Crotalaria pallida TaxID=3830 RepID=A0AAN9I158_CROPI
MKLIHLGLVISKFILLALHYLFRTTYLTRLLKKKFSFINLACMARKLGETKFFYMSISSAVFFFYTFIFYFPVKSIEIFPIAKS